MFIETKYYMKIKIKIKETIDSAIEVGEKLL
jgi:hypothetical protein